MSALLVIPFLPAMPSSGLDASWGYALNEAIDRRIVFGKDLIFTFGPLGSAYTQMYHPATDGIMLLTCTVLSVALCAGFAVLAIPRRPLALLLLPVVLATAQSRDAIFVAIPFCMAMATFVVTRRGRGGVTRALPKPVCAALIFIGAACGMLPLVKGSFVAVTLFLCCCSIVLLARARHFKLAVAIPIVVLVSMVGCWIGVGQSLFTLPNFFIAQLPIISGYAGAMSSEGSFWVVAIWLLPTAAALAIVYFCLSRGEGADGVVLWIGVLGYFFITFKASFVRQDDGHLYTALAALSLVSLIFVMSVRLRIALLYAVLAFFSWSSIEIQTNNFHPRQTAMSTWYAVHRTAVGMKLRLASPRRLRTDFDNANSAIRAAFPIGKVEEPVDIYPTELAPIFAHDLKWAGRPVPQSYSAYTPTLDLKDAEHLKGANAPRTVFYSVASIDLRLPSLEDSSSLPILLTQYRVAGRSETALQFVRSPHPAAIDFRKLDEREAELNKDINVPPSRDPVLAKIVVRQTILGKLMSAAFKLPSLYIETKFEDGRVQRNRFIPGMAKNGFVVAPYVGSVDSVVDIAADMSTKEVKQIRIVGSEAGYWRKKIHVEFFSFPVSPQDTAMSLAGVAPKSASPALLHGVSSTLAQCYLESINGVSKAKFPADGVETGNAASVVGWASPSTEKGIAPDEIWLALASESGATEFYKARIKERSDVAAAFHHAEMANVGFNVKVRETATGPMSISILTVREGVVQDCGIRQRVIFAK
ncbi:hypothetical protein [Paraburkholderia xenovorans]|uniref:hypothetical protein n=1 Tax=Paraburkholderia xenovorans TaxID=36873 RepID=UPI0011D08BD5|nr:hypothetical protein [Paraburkholderia xenovorans]